MDAAERDLRDEFSTGNRSGQILSPAVGKDRTNDLLQARIYEVQSHRL